MPLTKAMIAAQLGASLDVLRGVIRENPDLRALGTVLGSQRVYSADDVAKIRAAWLARCERRKPQLAAV